MLYFSLVFTSLLRAAILDGRKVAMLSQKELSKLQFIYVTTRGRKTGLPREIEIWFVEHAGKFYIFAEHFYKANWVQNIEKYSQVKARLGKQTFSATARILDEKKEAELWRATQQLCRDKYGWGEGLPVEITPDDRLS
jgi:deazaflavin-dependent oxidoreductase (nitroreductase family)